MPMKTLRIYLCASALAALACASNAATPELVDARRAYDQLRTSEANATVPDRVVTAQQALDRAERAHADSPGSFEERNRAYSAQRQAELAVAYSDLKKAEN